MRRILATLVLALAAAALVLVGRGLLLRPTPAADVAPAPRLALGDDAAIVERLAGAIRIPTVSHQDPADDDPAVFAAFREHLERSYPALHAHLAREIVNGRSLLYTWKGRAPSLPGVVLMAHQDVVPVEPGTESAWQQPPFSGAVADGFIWGRGTLDTKGKLTALCEAVELLAREGFQPTRTTLLVFGHDEEVGGEEGTAAVVRRLTDAGLHFAWVQDEGGAIGNGLVTGVAQPVALVGVAEKGYMTISVTAHADGGHSSMPPPHTAIGSLARAIERLEDHPMPAALRGATRDFLAAVGPEMTFALRVAVANADVLEPLLVRFLADSPRGNALVRTTTAVTMIDGGVKENALPAAAHAIVNFRVLPGDSIDGVLAHVRAAIDDPSVEIALLPGSNADEPSPESPVDSESFALLSRTIREIYPGTVVAPNLVLGATDSRWFRDISDAIYRFGPLHVQPDDLKRAHGTNERIGVEDYLDSVRFYVQLLRNAD